MMNLGYLPGQRELTFPEYCSIYGEGYGAQSGSDTLGLCCNSSSSHNPEQFQAGGADSKQRTVFCLHSLEDPENIAWVN